MVLTIMKDQTNAQDCLDQTRMKYSQYKMKVEGRAPKLVDRKTDVCKAFFGGPVVAEVDMDFSWLDKDNILKVYNNFNNEFKKNKNTYSRKDFDEIKALHEASDSRTNNGENEGLTCSDNTKSAEIKLKFGPKFKWERMGAEASEHAEAKE